MIKRLHESGDTIVEALIAVAIAGLLITTSYAISNKSSLSIRTAEERGEAQKLAAAQIELLKVHVATPAGSALLSAGTQPVFCLYTDASGVVLRKDDALPSSPAIVPGLSVSIGAIASECKTAPTGGSEYYLAVQKNTGGSIPAFSVFARWEGISGGFNEVRYEYAP